MDILSGKRGFESDNCSSVHPRIMQALMQANTGHASGYGYDPVTQRVDALFCELFGRTVYPFYVFNGTGSNSAALAHVVMPYQAIVCAAPSHINSAETGAVERIANAKIVALPSHDGKLTCEQVAEYLGAWQSEHTIMPRVLHLTQVTDEGAVYTAAEIAALCQLAHQHGLLVHMDGARLANAVAANGDDLVGTTCGAGVDILSFGGTKNGMMFGEAVIFFDEELCKSFKYTRKSCGQLPSKMRYIAAQFAEYLKDGLWLEMAHHANDMAQYLYQKMAASSCFKTPYVPQANELFAFVDEDIHWALAEKYTFLNFGPDPGISRFVTAFDTQREDVDGLVKAAEELKSGG